MNWEWKHRRRQLQKVRILSDLAFRTMILCISGWLCRGGDHYKIAEITFVASRNKRSIGIYSS
jgi:hypothetical protein